VIYPQGIIISCIKEKVIGIVDYDECKNSSYSENIYTGKELKGIVSGFDEINLWVTISSSPNSWSI